MMKRFGIHLSLRRQVLRVTFGGLGVLGAGLNIDLNVLQAPSGNPAIGCGAANQFAGLSNNSSTTIPRNNLATTHDLTCLIPGRKYYLQVDGSDVSVIDRGTFTVAVSDLDPSFVAGATVPNDEPCGAIDITQFIRTVVQDHVLLIPHLILDNISLQVVLQILTEPHKVLKAVLVTDQIAVTIGLKSQCQMMPMVYVYKEMSRMKTY